MKINSPFHIIENFISPSACEKLIEEYALSTPSLDENDKPLKYEKILQDTSILQTINSGLFQQQAEIETRYNAKINGIQSMRFMQYFENPEKPCEIHGCENSKYLRKKWVKVKDNDLVGFLWLKDYNNNVPLDPRYEVYGGKLEFPAYDFSLVPQRGTLILFPGGPHFITAISPILIGSLYQVKINICLSPDDGSAMWMYNPKRYPVGKSGFIDSWFKEHV